MLKNPKYVYGPRDVDIPMRINFGEFVLNKFMQHKNKTAIINENSNTSVTYLELCQKAVNFAVSLTRLGVRKGEVIAICSENRFDVWSAVVGVACAGAVMTPLNMGYTQGELKHVLSISKPAYIIASPSCFKTHEKTFRSQASVKKIITFGDDRSLNTIAFDDLVKDHVNIEEFEVPEVQGQTDTLFILYSSGTTGLPKGVVLTHLNVIVTMLLPGLQEAPEFISPATISVAPWFHAMGLMYFLNNLSQGLRLVTLEKFEVELYMKTVEKYKVTTLLMVPPILIATTKADGIYDVSSVKIITCGAAPLSADILPAVKSRFPNLVAVIQGYGMTESTLAIAKDFNNGRSVKHGSLGPVVSGCIVKIADLETREPLGPRNQGEICVKSVTLMKGYIGKDMKDDFDEDGFFKTGDVGYYDEDGFLYIVDRLKELIKYKGNQVPPAEIEAVLLQHPGVRDAGVVGLPHAASGELPLAFVVAQPGSTVTEEELKKFVAERQSTAKPPPMETYSQFLKTGTLWVLLSQSSIMDYSGLHAAIFFKAPHINEIDPSGFGKISKLSNPKQLRGGVRFVNEIPKNPSGKILRKNLRLLVNKEKIDQESALPILMTVPTSEIKVTVHYSHLAPDQHRLDFGVHSLSTTSGHQFPSSTE
ncbi:hypothetical protein MSG28_015082 [Choristoneura fumiferana]|uniref:Uncharacterized protein n=1 Tax=Choristoneura fumiferana TaxID=7141 RepID=A0ACC0KYG1_CHOFU|nr:hypothetical protein MSG28_015082 [Choristoneura fumiferana]